MTDNKPQDVEMSQMSPAGNKKKQLDNFSQAIQQPSYKSKKVI